MSGWSRSPTSSRIMQFSTTPTPLHGPSLTPLFAVVLVAFPAGTDPGCVHLAIPFLKADSQLGLLLWRQKLNKSQKYSCCEQAAVEMNEKLTFRVCSPILSSSSISYPLHLSTLSSCCCVSDAAYGQKSAAPWKYHNVCWQGTEHQRERSSPQPWLELEV